MSGAAFAQNWVLYVAVNLYSWKKKKRQSQQCIQVNTGFLNPCSVLPLVWVLLSPEKMEKYLQIFGRFSLSVVAYRGGVQLKPGARWVNPSACGSEFRGQCQVFHFLEFPCTLNFSSHSPLSVLITPIYSFHRYLLNLVGIWRWNKIWWFLAWKKAVGGMKGGS